MHSLPRWTVPLGVTALVVLDQATKHWVQQSMALAASIPVVEGVFHLTYYANHGAVGGIGRHWSLTMPVLIGIGVAMLLAVTVAYVIVDRRVRLSWRAQLFVICALAPLLCTVLDRSRQGYVVDFLDVGVLPVFNVADLFANVGLVLLALEVGPWFRRRRPAGTALVSAEPSLDRLRAELRQLLEAEAREPHDGSSPGRRGA